MDIISNLPPELSLEIFRFLSPSELGVCCAVCKIWRYYANSDVLWKRLCKKTGILLPSESAVAHTGHCSCSLDMMSTWAVAYARYALRWLYNWREDRKAVHMINTWNATVVAVSGTTLVYSDEMGAIFVYDVSERTRFIQTIELISDETVATLGLTESHLIVRQGDIFTIYSKYDNSFLLEGFLVPIEGAYLFTREYYLSEMAFIKHANIEDGVCMLYDNCLYIYSLRFSTIHTFKVESLTFFLHDLYCVYVGTGRNTVTGFDSNGYYTDFDLIPSSVMCMKSNREMTVSLICEDHFHSGRYYFFKIWLRSFRLCEFETSRPFGIEVAPSGLRFASVAHDKFGNQLLVTLYEMESRTKYKLDLNVTEAIAQAKLQFIGKDMLYVVTRGDWGPFDTGYLVDLTTMQMLYQTDLFHTNVISVDSKLAVYLNSEAVEIHYYNR